MPSIVFNLTISLILVACGVVLIGKGNAGGAVLLACVVVKWALFLRQKK